MKISLYISMLAVVVALTSCNSQNNLDIVDMPNIVTFNISTNSPQVRGSADIKRYIMEFHTYDNSNGDEILIDHIEQNNGNFSVELDLAATYRIYFWADGATVDDNSNGAYNAASLSNAITLNEGKDISEAYYGYLELDASSNTSVSNIKLKRSIAEINLLETGIIAIEQKLTARYEHSTQFRIISQYTSPHSEKIEKVLTPAATNGKIGTLLMFASRDGELADFSFSYSNITNTIVNVPIKSNWITNISGEFAVKKDLPEAIFTITTDDKWEGIVISDKTPINIPDVNLKKSLLRDCDIDGDKEISLSEASLVKSLSIYSYGSPIASFVGVEHFINLETLNIKVSNNFESNLDVSKCIKLKNLDCDNLNLITLNVSGCIELKVLNCSTNSLTTLDISNTNIFSEGGGVDCFMPSLKTLYLKIGWENLNLNIDQGSEIIYK